MEDALTTGDARKSKIYVSRAELIRGLLRVHRVGVLLTVQYHATYLSAPFLHSQNARAEVWGSRSAVVRYVEAFFLLARSLALQDTGLRERLGGGILKQKYPEILGMHLPIQTTHKHQHSAAHHRTAPHSSTRPWLALQNHG